MPKKFLSLFSKLPLAVVITLVLVAASGGYAFYLNQKLQTSNDLVKVLQQQIVTLEKQIADLESEDPRATNKERLDTINQLKRVYRQSVAVYEDLVDLKVISKNTAKLDEAYASSISSLASENYATAEAKLTQLSKDIAAEKAKATIASIPNIASVPVNNTPPGSGYSRQTVQTDAGSFVVSIVSADLAGTKVIVDTASDSSCGNDCPVLPLATYVSRSGAYAGINGSYFCPASYPTCAGKTNSFDLLVMNKNKTYFNSDNNVYSSNPGVIFSSGSIRFVSAVSQWGRDTGIDSMLSNYPMLVQGGNITFGGNDDPKQGSKGNRSFVSNKGNTVFIGVVHSATVAEAARVMKAMGMENALNLDDGGSTALWSGGYKLGPGRELPNAILFVKK